MSDEWFFGLLIASAVASIWYLICGIFLQDEWEQQRKERKQSAEK